MEKKPSVITWLAAAGLCAGLLPDLVLEVIALGREEPLPYAASLGISVLGVFACMLCLLRAVYIRFGKEPAEEGKKPDRILYLTGLFPCVLVCMATIYVMDSARLVFTVGFAAKPALFGGLMAALLFIAVLLLGLFFFCFLGRCRKTPLKRSALRFFARIYLGIPMGVLLWLAILASPLGLVFVGNLWDEPPLLARHIVMVLCSLGTGAVLNGAFFLAEKMMQNAVTVPEAGAQTSWQREIPSLVCLVLCLFLLVVPNRVQLFGGEAAQLDRQLKESLTEYSILLSAYDIAGAAQVVEDAVEQMDTALAAAREEAEQAEDEAGQRKAEKKEKALQKVCDRYEIFRTDGQALIYLEQYQKDGGADADLVEEALFHSEQYPENLQAQYAAAVIGTGLTYDNAPHYDRTARAILRWEELYLAERKPADTERCQFELGVARMLVTIYHEEEASEILEEILGVLPEAEGYELLARCYDRMGRQEDAYALAVSCSEEGVGSPYLIYYAALSALKLGKTQESLTYTSQLASIAAACEEEQFKKAIRSINLFPNVAFEEELADCDVWLFEMLEFLTLSDNREYTEFEYDVYEELTEEENALIDANPFFRNYLDAVYLAYNSDHKSEPADAFEKIEAVLEVNPKLASAWYVRGIIASNAGTEEYWREAVTYYQTAGALNGEIPAVWYAMAREYDRIGEYEKGIEACKRALALLPEQDHGTDWYGIQYHCSRLLKALENEVGQ